MKSYAKKQPNERVSKIEKEVAEIKAKCITLEEGILKRLEKVILIIKPIHESQNSS